MNQYIKTTLLLFDLVVFFPLSSATAQDKGFFNLYERPEGSFCASAAIETDDGNYVVAIYDYDGGSGELVLLSKNGSLIKQVPIITEGNKCGIEHLYQDPYQEGLFYGIGEISDPVNQTFLPFIIHFDEKLNILFRKDVQLPDKYKHIRISRSLLTQNNNFLYAGSLDQDNDYHRLYMTISLDGEVEEMTEIDADASISTYVDAICESPVSSSYYEYRVSTNNYGQRIKRLYSFDDRFVFEPINDYDSIHEWIGDVLYNYEFYYMANSTMTLLDDTTLLLSDRIVEYRNPIYGSDFSTERSTILFTTDLEGNIKDYLVVGMDNDTSDIPFSFNSIAVMKELSTEETCIYHGCYGYFFPYRSNNITLTKTDRNLNPLWKRAYSYHDRYLQTTYMVTTTDGDCLIIGGAWLNWHYDWFALKVNADGLVDTDEIMVENCIVCFPNPATEELFVRWSPDVQPEQMALYDMQGRLVRTQGGGMERMGLEGLAPGLYTLRVTFADGSSHTDKMVKR